MKARAADMRPRASARARGRGRARPRSCARSGAIGRASAGTSSRSVWVARLATKSGGKRYRVMYRLGGRETVPKHAGSFRTQRDALTRKAWVSGELAAMRVPDLGLLAIEQPKAPTLRDAAERWRASRI